MIDKDYFDEIQQQGTQAERIYQAALAYIKAGIRVIPLRPGSKKLPAPSTGITYASASRAKKIIDGWFHPDKGKFSGWNIGIACGAHGGVWALDIDRKGDIDGLAELEEIEGESGALPEAPMAITPTGGRHYLFRWRDNAVSSARKLGQSIDTRGGPADQCTSHIVAFPSIINGKTYHWEKGGHPPEIPDWVIDRLGKTWDKRPRPGAKNGNRGNEEVDNEDYEQQLDPGQIRRMLAAIDPDDLDYDAWLNIGQAINTQHPDDTGLELWGEWSRRGSRFKRGECSFRWKGFSPLGSIRVGTLFHYAKQAGWKPEKDDKHLNQWEELVNEMNETYAMVVVGGRVRVIQSVPDAPNDPSLPAYNILAKEDFRSLLANEIHAVATETKVVYRSSADIWLTSQLRRTYPNGMGMFPGVCPPGYYNTYRGFAVEPRPGDWSLFKEHLLNILCRGNKHHYEWLIDWMADCVQDPDHPKGTAIVMRGKEGIGKGTFAKLFGALWGTHFKHLIDDSHLLSNFNAHMMEAIVVFADEIVWGGNRKSAGKLRGIVTEKYVIGERKGVDASPYRNCSHLIIASNNDWVVPAGPDSRRWFVVNVDPRRASDMEYFNAIHKQMEWDGGLEAMLYDLMERKIEANLTKAPVTTELMNQRLTSESRDSYRDPFLEWWGSCLLAEHLDAPPEAELGEEVEDWPKVVDRGMLWQTFCDWHREHLGSSYAPPREATFYKRMELFGLKKIRPQAEGVRRYRFEVPPLGEAVEIYEERTGEVLKI